VEVVLILVFTALGLLGSAAVGRVELVIVLIKLSVLGVFVVLGIWTVHPAWITPEVSGGQAGHVLSAMAVFFLSYMGFGLVTNASEDMERPERNVPRAIYLSILVVTVIYVMVSVVAVGNLQIPELIQAQDNALAVAAQPFLGQLGYAMVSVGALFSISSALNATLFGGANIAYALAKEGELPEVFERKRWFGAPEGLYLTAGLGLAFALLFNLSGIASITSAVFMVIYLFVLASHLRLAGETGGRRPLIAFSFLVVMVMFVVLLHYQWQNSRAAFYGIWITFLGAVVVEVVYRLVTQRELVVRELEHVEDVIESFVASRRE
jgi:amino acid transporter